MKNIRSIKYIAIFASLLSVSSFAQVPYKTESKSNWSYICDSDWEGGVNHTKDSHIPVSFKPVTKLKIHHISLLPDEITGLMKDSSELSVKEYSTKRDAIKALYEKKFLKISDVGKFRIEQNSYSLRETSNDPAFFWSYAKCSSTFDEGKLYSISCQNDSEMFSYNAENNRFVYSRIGTWHSNPKKKMSEGYYGDSSAFSYGTCQRTFD